MLQGKHTEATIADAISRAKDLTVRLLGELDAVTTRAGELEELIIDETAGDQGARRRNGMLRAVSLGARSTTLKTLLASATAWADLERSLAPDPGKKLRRLDAAQEAGAGKFATPPAPRQRLQ